MSDGRAAEIVFDHVTKRYPGRAAPAVDDLTLTVPAGEICVLVGPSGGGKTTAMKMVNRLIDITEGDIRIGGRSVRGLDVTELRRSIGYVIQQTGLFPHMTVADNVATVPRLLGWDKRRIDARVDELLDLVDLPAQDYRARYATQLSGGERQRVGLARALALNPSFVIADEPVSALDVSVQAQVVNLLMDLQQRLKLTYLFIAHDLRLVRHICSRVAVMYLGRIVEMGPTERLFDAPAHPYTRALLSAIPVPDPTAPRQRIVLDPASFKRDAPLRDIADGHRAAI
jgi:osmoprotectant transport system ATP-binding protein